MGVTLVAGASGFTGRALCRRLAEDGEEVVALLEGTAPDERLGRLGVECRHADLQDSAALGRQMRRVSTVYQVPAARAAEYTNARKHGPAYLRATRNLLDAARAQGVERFVHCSTAAVHGDVAHPPADESHPFHPMDDYLRSRLEGELLARDYFARGLPGVVVRVTGIYGPGDMRLLKLFRAIKRGYFAMIGPGDAYDHMTYVEDLIQGILLCGRKPEAVGEVFIVAGEQYTTKRDLVHLIADVLGRPHPAWRIPYLPTYLAAALSEKICLGMGLAPPLYRSRVRFFRVNRAFSIEKAKKRLGFRPRVNLPEGLARTAAWYAGQKLI